MIRLADVDVLKLVPEFMRKDKAVLGLVASVNALMRDSGGKIKTARVWDQIDKLDDPQLDELAYELDVDWYSEELPTENKRALLKSADLIHSRRGTKWAVEQVLIDTFGSGAVIEWYDYNGQPFHFRVSTDFPLESQDVVEQFRKAVAVAKPCRSVLDSIEFAHTGASGTFTATAGIGIAIQAAAIAINL